MEPIKNFIFVLENIFSHLIMRCVRTRDQVTTRKNEQDVRSVIKDIYHSISG